MWSSVTLECLCLLTVSFIVIQDMTDYIMVVCFTFVAKISQVKD